MELVACIEMNVKDTIHNIKAETATFVTKFAETQSIILFLLREFLPENEADSSMKFLDIWLENDSAALAVLQTERPSSSGAPEVDI